MTSLTEFFNKHEDDALKGISHKNSIIKRNIIAYMACLLYTSPSPRDRG